MKNKILLIAVLILLLINFSSCVMRQERAPHTYWSLHHTHRHWGSRKVFQHRHQFWGRHRYGPRPYRNRGHYNY